MSIRHRAPPRLAGTRGLQSFSHRAATLVALIAALLVTASCRDSDSTPGTPAPTPFVDNSEPPAPPPGSQDRLGTYPDAPAPVAPGATPTATPTMNGELP